MSPYYYRLSTNYSPIMTEEMSPGQSMHAHEQLKCKKKRKIVYMLYTNLSTASAR